MRRLACGAALALAGCGDAAPYSATLEGSAHGDSSPGAHLGVLRAELRGLNPAEARADLEEMFRYVRALYAPYEYKEDFFGLSLSKVEEEARQRLRATPGEDGFYAVANWYLARLGDAHVRLGNGPRSSPLNYRIGISLQAVEGRALVASLSDPSLAALGIARGDEVLSVDGTAPQALLPMILEFRDLGNPVSNEQLVAHVFLRPGFAAALRPRGPTARVVFRRAAGTEYVRDLTWRQDEQTTVGLVRPTAFSTGLESDGARFEPGFESEDASFLDMGAVRPFFATDATLARFGITAVTLSAERAAAAGLGSAALPEVYSAVYSHQGKRLLLVRIANYSPPDTSIAFRYYSALLAQHEGSVDGLVLDQTHNPGGGVEYGLRLLSLFVPDESRRFGVALNPDRRWIDGFRSRAVTADATLVSELSRGLLLRGAKVEAAYDAGQDLTEPIYIVDERLLVPPGYQWRKPVVVLIDELASSGGDQFPMLMQANRAGLLFGERTMGAGGTVEAVGQLTHSNAPLRLTRGLFLATRPNGEYSSADFVENRGAVPEIHHEITVSDFRAGFLEYVTHFSDVAVAHIEQATRPAEVAAPEDTAPPSAGDDAAALLQQPRDAGVAVD